MEISNIEKLLDEEKIPKDITVTDLDMQTIQTKSTLDKAFDELYANINLEQKTEFLKNDEIKKLGTLFSMASHYHFIALQERIIKHMQMRVSLKRRGREEAVKLVQAERQHEEARNILDKYGRGTDER